MPVQAAPPATTGRRVTMLVMLAINVAGGVWFFTVSPILGGVFAGFLGLTMSVGSVRAVRERRSFVREHNAAIAALARGELEKAHDVFRSWAKDTRVPRIAALSRHNLGWTLLRMGKLEESLAVYVDNEEYNPNALKAIGLACTSALDIALDHALLGDLAAAETWMATAEQRQAGLTLPTVPGMKAFTRAVIDCRSARAADAARMLADGWAEYEGTLQGDTMRPLRVVRAFAIAQAGPREAGNAEVLLAASRPAYPREYEFLGTHWPDMASFLAAHGLAPAPRTTSA